MALDGGQAADISIQCSACPTEGGTGCIEVAHGLGRTNGGGSIEAAAHHAEAGDAGVTIDDQQVGCKVADTKAGQVALGCGSSAHAIGGEGAGGGTEGVDGGIGFRIQGCLEQARGFQGEIGQGCSQAHGRCIGGAHQLGGGTQQGIGAGVIEQRIDAHRHQIGFGCGHIQGVCSSSHRAGDRISCALGKRCHAAGAKDVEVETRRDAGEIGGGVASGGLGKSAGARCGGIEVQEGLGREAAIGGHIDIGGNQALEQLAQAGVCGAISSNAASGGGGIHLNACRQGEACGHIELVEVDGGGDIAGACCRGGGTTNAVGGGFDRANIQAFDGGLGVDVDQGRINSTGQFFAEQTLRQVHTSGGGGGASDVGCGCR